MVAPCFPRESLLFLFPLLFFCSCCAALLALQFRLRGGIKPNVLSAGRTVAKLWNRGLTIMQSGGCLCPHQLVLPRTFRLCFCAERPALGQKTRRAFISLTRRRARAAAEHVDTDVCMDLCRCLTCVFAWNARVKRAGALRVACLAPACGAFSRRRWPVAKWGEGARVQLRSAAAARAADAVARSALAGAAAAWARPAGRRRLHHCALPRCDGLWRGLELEVLRESSSPCGQVL